MDTNVVRMDSVAYQLLKEYALERGVPMACAIGEVMTCPVKSHALETNDSIPVNVKSGIKSTEDEKEDDDFFGFLK